jgi:hypothetical protein
MRRIEEEVGVWPDAVPYPSGSPGSFDRTTHACLQLLRRIPPVRRLGSVRHPPRRGRTVYQPATIPDHRSLSALARMTPVPWACVLSSGRIDT